jgi:hypothetical protein
LKASDLAGKTGSKIAQMFGVKWEDIAGTVEGLGSETAVSSVSAEAMQRLRGAVAGKGVGVALAGSAGSAMSGSKDEQLMEVLNGVKKSIDLNSTTIQIAYGDKLGLSKGEVKYLQNKNKRNIVGEIPVVDGDGNVIPGNQSK